MGRRKKEQNYENTDLSNSIRSNGILGKQTESFSLDFCFSNDPKELHQGVIETTRGMKFSILAISITLFRIKNGFYFRDLGFADINSYLKFLESQTGIARTTLYGWVKIGECFFIYQKELERINFHEEDGLTKLRYIEIALKNHPKKEVFSRIKRDTQRDFYLWSKTPHELEKVISPVKVSYKVRKNQVYVGDVPILNIPENIPPHVSNKLIEIVTKVYTLMEEGKEPIITFD